MRRPLAVFGVLTMLALTAACADKAEPGSSRSGPAATTTTATNTGETQADALYYYPPTVGATFTYTNGGTVSGTTEVTVTKVDKDSTGTKVTVKEVVSGQGTPVTVDRVFQTTAAGGLSISAGQFGASAPGFKVTAVGDDIKIPPVKDLEAGKTSTGSTFVEFSGSGISGRNDVTYTVSGGGFETKTAPGGGGKAYKVVSLTLKSSVGTVPATATYWFLPGKLVLAQDMQLAGVSATTALSKSSVSVS